MSKNSPPRIIAFMIGAATAGIIASQFNELIVRAFDQSSSYGNRVLYLLGLFVCIILSAYYTIYISRYSAIKNKNKIINKVKQEYGNSSVVAIFIKKLDENFYIASYIVTLFIPIYFITCKTTGVIFRNEIIYSLVIFLLFSFSYRTLIDYRFKKGFLFNNSSEARELIGFIESNSEDIDFTDGDGGSKPIIKSHELEDIALSIAREAQKA